MSPDFEPLEQIQSEPEEESDDASDADTVIYEPPPTCELQVHLTQLTKTELAKYHVKSKDAVKDLQKIKHTK